MKKLLLALLGFQALCTAQTTQVTLKASYKPNTEYTINQVNDTRYTIKYTGTDEVMEALKEKGITTPTEEASHEENKMKITTGAVANGEFPVEMRILQSLNPQLKKLAKTGAIIHGHSKETGLPVFDSISHTTLSKNLQKIFIDAMQGMLSQIKYPPQTIKVGESASIDIPFTLPIDSMVLNMNIACTYTLKSIEGNTANFDIEMVYTVTSQVKDYELLGGGDSTGTMKYDIANDYYSQMDLDMNLDISVDMSVVVINLTMDQKSSQSAQIKQLK